MNDVTKSGRTPLYWACRSSHQEMAHELIKYGADPHIPDDLDGKSAMEWARLVAPSGSFAEAIKVSIHDESIHRILRLLLFRPRTTT